MIEISENYASFSGVQKEKLPLLVNSFLITSNPNIIDNYDVQQLLISSKLLITDYSSVFFDFAYMKKPSIYYQFDSNTFFAKHYKKGYFDYSENGFGDVALSVEELLLSLKGNIDLDFVPNMRYLERMNSFFELYDDCNCERIYQLIEAL